MLNKFTRKLNPQEISYIETEILRLTKKIKFQKRFTIVSMVILFCLSILLFFLFSDNFKTGLALGIFVLLGLYLFTSLWTNYYNIRNNTRSLENHQFALEHQVAEIIQCHSEAILKMEDSGFEGPDYFFQVEENLIFYLGGQAYYEDEKFPNSDFEVTRIFGKEKAMVFFDLQNKGIKVKPQIVIKRKGKKKYLQSEKFPKNYEVMEGNIKTLENTLQMSR
ncbi:hypothetical protein [Flexithrix dorotheae]|uniref:hypothetical protein n=1 Tax=Flexithrix dorotheae TaxID=70993 RepID=UPI0003624E50|nr:hypothetical protein [Flexithrix dorotheae]